MNRLLRRPITFSTLALLAMTPLAMAAENFMTPTKHHNEMARDVGVWDAEVSMWMEPESEPVKSKAVETNKMLGKMWLLSEFEGSFGGEKFSGRGAFGYDPIKKKYVGGWIDTMSPFMMKMEGDYDVETHTLTMLGEGTDCMTGKACKSKIITRYESEDSKTFEMHGQGEDGKWFKTMEAKYTRRK